MSQYFYNHNGDDWPDALAGLEAMESRERLSVLREAVEKFGDAGPSVNRSQRIAQLSEVENANDAVFDTLDSRYYKSTEIIAKLTARYVIKNLEAFR